MHQSQLMISGDLRPLARPPFRPLAAMGVTIASWALGCALAGDAKDDTKSGLHAGGPLVGCFMTAKVDCPLKCSEIDFDAVGHGLVDRGNAVYRGTAGVGIVRIAPAGFVYGKARRRCHAAQAAEIHATCCGFYEEITYGGACGVYAVAFGGTR